MLSQENIDKLVPYGIYACDPILEILPEYKRKDPYWCMNWTFTWRKGSDDNFYMIDTYWSTDSYKIELTDENFNNFKLLFRQDEVEKMPEGTLDECNSEDRWRVAIDSGGWSYPKFFIRKGAKKIKKLVIERIKSEIRLLEMQLEYKKTTLERVINDEVDLKYV